jgi:hypothetical protein
MSSIVLQFILTILSDQKGSFAGFSAVTSNNEIMTLGVDESSIAFLQNLNVSEVMSIIR